VDFLRIGRSAAGRQDGSRDLARPSARGGRTERHSVADVTLRIRGAESRRDHVERDTPAARDAPL